MRHPKRARSSEGRQHRHQRALGSSLRVGPKTFQETHNFADALLVDLEKQLGERCADIEDALLQLTVKQLHITTSYSGVGSAEWAVKFIRRAFKGRGFDVGMQMYSACYNDDNCIEVLSYHKEPPLRCFDNLLDRTPAHALAKLRDLQYKYLAKLPPAMTGNRAARARAA